MTISESIVSGVKVLTASVTKKVYEETPSFIAQMEARVSEEDDNQYPIQTVDKNGISIPPRPAPIY